MLSYLARVLLCGYTCCPYIISSKPSPTSHRPFSKHQLGSFEKRTRYPRTMVLQKGPYHHAQEQTLQKSITPTTPPSFPHNQSERTIPTLLIPSKRQRQKHHSIRIHRRNHPHFLDRQKRTPITTSSYSKPRPSADYHSSCSRKQNQFRNLHPIHPSSDSRALDAIFLQKPPVFPHLHLPQHLRAARLRNKTPSTPVYQPACLPKSIVASRHSASRLPTQPHPLTPSIHPSITPEVQNQPLQTSQSVNQSIT